MLATCVVDVDFRTVVLCLDEFDYLALSYVWSGMHSAPRISEAETLLQTIEDALTLTQK